MTLLYRSPNIVIDGHEWHVTVDVSQRGKVSRNFRFRPCTHRRVRWAHITEWPLSQLPLGLKEKFRPYFASMRTAERSVTKRPRVYIRRKIPLAECRHAA